MINLNELPFGSDFKTTWAEWLQFRKEGRFKTYKPTGLKKTLSMLIRISNNDEKIAIKIIEQSMEQNWQGLFELKKQKNAISSTTKGKSAGADQLLEELRANFKPE